MRAVLTIAWNDLGRVFREREALFWVFVGPAIFTVFFGLLFRPHTTQPPRLSIVDRDAASGVADRLRTLLSDDGVSVTAATAVVPGRLTLVVPSGTGAQIAANGKVELTLYAVAEETDTERTIRFKVQKALTRLYFARAGAGPAAAVPPAAPSGSPGTGPPAPAAASGAETGSPDGPLVVTDGDLGVRRREMTAGFQRSVPAYLVMFVFLNLLVSGAGIAEDRASGRLRRIAIAPVRRWQIVLGKLLGRFGIGWVQIVYMLLLGIVVGIRWAEHGWTLVAFLSLFALASASLGILLGTLFKDPDKCASVAVWIAILLSPLGGLWWPLEVVGPFMRSLANFVPTGWAMEGVNAMLAFGAGPLEVAPYAAGFLLLFAVSFPLAARRLQP